MSTYTTNVFDDGHTVLVRDRQEALTHLRGISTMSDQDSAPSPKFILRLSDNLATVLIILASLATCAVCDHNESQAERACFEAGNDPEECDL